MIAVKQIEKLQTASDKNNSRQVQALKLESEILKDLDHPNIVQYLGFEETPSALSMYVEFFGEQCIPTYMTFSFLEYVPGGSVGSCLSKHGKFDEDVTKSFTMQILNGLEYLHSKGIILRVILSDFQISVQAQTVGFFQDLKADDVLVEMSGVCKISGFGISRQMEDGSGEPYTVMEHNAFWMAPEVINIEKGYNFKIDIWNVGCVVLEMWTGMPRHGAFEVMFKVLPNFFRCGSSSPC